MISATNYSCCLKDMVIQQRIMRLQLVKSRCTKTKISRHLDLMRKFSMHSDNKDTFQTRTSFLYSSLGCSYSQEYPTSENVQPLVDISKTFSHINGLEHVGKDSFCSLEWSSVCEQLSQFTSTSMGYMLAKKGAIPIGANIQSSKNLLDQTTSALLLTTPPNFSDIQDITSILDSVCLGDTCTVRQLCSVKRTLQSARSIFENLCKFSQQVTSVGGHTFEPLLQIFAGADFCIDLINDLDHCIDCNFLYILDRASTELADTRSKRKRNMIILEEFLKEISSRIARAGAIDSPLITKRRGRLCVGIKASHKSFLRGAVLLDVSGSGATYYMEPEEAVSLNNTEIQLSATQRSEELAILSRLSEKIATRDTNIRNILERVMVIDLACARAGHARWLNSVLPTFSEEEYVNYGDSFVQAVEKVEISKTGNFFVDIENIQHPLLLGIKLKKKGKSHSDELEEKESVFPVPIDIKISTGKKVVILSGPNTGGKTATLKTLGLAAFMAKAGFYLPAKGQPKLPWFDRVMVDIGDNQSLEQSLSTFGGHIQQFCKILKAGTGHSLVLIDEIGSGTDPAEGVALATSILQHLANHVCLTVITTHYSDLSILKTVDSRFENAAMEFDLRTLNPTYCILWGSAGQSYALEVAQSIGFDCEILNRARKWVAKLQSDAQKKRQSELFESLCKQRDGLKNQKSVVTSILEEAKQLQDELLAETENLDERETALKLKGTEDIDKKLAEAKMQLDELIANFEKKMQGDVTNIGMKAMHDAISFIVNAYCPILSETEEKVAHTHITTMPDVGDKVLIKKFGGEPAIVIKAPSKEDSHILVKLGGIKMRVKLNEIENIVCRREDTHVSNFIF